MSSARRGRGSKAGGLGRSLLRKQERRFATSSRHTTDDSGATAPMTSITENTSIDEFLSNAEAAQRSFEAERTRRIVATHEGDVEDCSEDDEDDEDDGQGGHVLIRCYCLLLYYSSFLPIHQSSNMYQLVFKQLVFADSDDSDSEAFFSIPKKPQWSESQSAEEYRRSEQLSFLDWKRAIAKVQKKHPHLPPFEKNLDFWRQLWKMVEISDVVVQVRHNSNDKMAHT
jgi:large subunit GTPase 1